MSAQYEYSLQDDFGNNLELSSLKTLIQQEVKIISQLVNINTVSDTVFITFDTSLSQAEYFLLDDIVTNYNYEEPSANFLYDKQYIVNQITTSTTASSFVDLDSMTLTTKDLGEPCCYIVTFNSEISCSSNNNQCEFQILVEGKTDSERVMRYTQPRNSNGSTKFNCFNISCFLENINSGTVIKVQYRRISNNSTIFVNLRKLIIDGVRNSEINN